MDDDDKTLISALRGGGHDDVADALDRKLQAAEEPPQPSAPAREQSPDEQFLAELKAKSAGAWSSSTALCGE